MIPGLMQSAPLMISGILTYAAQAHGAREIVSRLIDEPIWRYDYAGLARRAAQAAHALHRLGVAPGDRVTSLAWNTHRHLELFYAVPGVAGGGGPRPRRPPRGPGVLKKKAPPPREF